MGIATIIVTTTIPVYHGKDCIGERYRGIVIRLDTNHNPTNPISAINNTFLNLNSFSLLISFFCMPI